MKESKSKVGVSVRNKAWPKFDIKGFEYTDVYYEVSLKVWSVLRSSTDRVIEGVKLGVHQSFLNL